MSLHCPVLLLGKVPAHPQLQNSEESEHLPDFFLLLWMGIIWKQCLSMEIPHSIVLQTLLPHFCLLPENRHPPSCTKNVSNAGEIWDEAQQRSDIRLSRALTPGLKAPK